MDRSQFFDGLTEEFELDPAPSGVERVIQDLGFDSLELMRLGMFLEIVCDVELPEQVDYDTLTIDDVWHYYLVQASRRPDSVV